MLKENLKEECKTIKQVVSDAFKKWRTNYANLSQQNIHDFCKAYDIPVYNSQIAYLERGNLDAKSMMYFGLEYMNTELATENNKFLKVQNKTLREKLIAAEPFLTHDDRVANRIDFSAIMLGEKINKKYLTNNSISITDELGRRYTELVIEEFHRVRNELLLNRTEMVETMLNTNMGKKIAKADVDKFKKIITGDYVFTGIDLTNAIKQYKTIPCFSCINEIKPSAKLQMFCKQIGL